MRSERNLRLPLRAILITSGIAGGLAAFAFGLFLLATSGDGDAAPPIVSASASPTAATPSGPPATAGPTDSPTRSALPTASPTPKPTATRAPTATPGPRYTAELAAWSEAESAWVTPLHNSSTSGYAEGEFVPFLVSIDHAEAGTSYQVRIKYDCRANGSPAFDFIGADPLASDQPLVTEPGPGSTLPTSMINIREDTSIPFDDARGGSLRAWGAVFSAADGPSPQTDCTGSKTVNVSLLAQDSTLTLVWTAHLASRKDWGGDDGSASAAPFSITVEVNGEVERTFTMAPGSIDF